MGRGRIKLASAAGLLMLVIAISGCGGGDGDGREEAGPAQATDTQEATTEPDPAAAVALAEIRESFELNFSTTSWYTDASNLEIVGGEHLEAHTDWFEDAEGEALALQLCNALNGNYIVAATADYGLDSVTVYGAGEPPAILASTSILDGTCES